MYPIKFENLILAFQKLPGVGRKTAERYAYETLNWNKNKQEEFIQAIEVLKEGIERCETCGNLCEGRICTICEDKNRDTSLHCVVQSPKDIEVIEAIQ